MPLHRCPVCGAIHEVPPALHELAYGRQFTCSPRCKAAFPRVVRARGLARLAKEGNIDNNGEQFEETAC